MTTVGGIGVVPVIAAPGVGFAALESALAATGWSLGAESQEPPVIAGEPHWCEWQHRVLSAGIAYTFNPIVKLRVLAFVGDDSAAAREQVSGAVAHLDQRQLELLLASDELRELLLGIYAAAELRAVAVLEQIRALQEHDDERVVVAAVQAEQEIMPPLLVEAFERLHAERRAHPERSALFANLGHAEQKRQVLRWLIHDERESNASIDEVLRTAFDDPDPEVRITAVLAATRLGAVRVASLVAGIHFPESTVAGADPRDRHLYQRIQQRAATYLAQLAARGDAAARFGTRDQWPASYQALGGPIAITDDMSLLVHALTTPLDLAAGPPPPTGDVSLAWVAPAVHWLGHDGTCATDAPNPLRSFAPARGFYISIDPVGPPCTREAADALASRSGMRLPTADEWECAMRGPDGRLYPWGNNLARSARGNLSPWGVAPAKHLEWTSDNQAGLPIVVGGERPLPCSRRAPSSVEQRCAVRLVLDP